MWAFASVSLAKQREFTTNHEVVLDAIDAAWRRPPPVERRVGSRTSPLLEAAPSTCGSGGATEPLDLKRFLRRASPRSRSSPTSVGTWRALPQRRKAVVYFGQAAGESGTGRARRTLATMHTFPRPVAGYRAARRANVSVSLLDPSHTVAPRCRGVAPASRALPTSGIWQGRPTGLAAMTGESFQVATPRLEAQVDRILDRHQPLYYLPAADAIRSAALAGFRRMASLPGASFREIAVRTPARRPHTGTPRHWPEAHGNPPPCRRVRARGGHGRRGWAAGGLSARSDPPIRVRRTVWRGRGGRHPVALVVEVQDPSPRGRERARRQRGVRPSWPTSGRRVALDASGGGPP